MTNNQLSTQQAKRDISVNALDWTFEDIKRYFDPQNLLTEKQVLLHNHCWQNST